MASCVANQISNFHTSNQLSNFHRPSTPRDSSCALNRCLPSRPDEESESTEWETDTDASDDEEGESEQARGSLGGQQRKPCCIRASYNSSSTPLRFLWQRRSVYVDRHGIDLLYMWLLHRLHDSASPTRPRCRGVILVFFVHMSHVSFLSTFVGLADSRCLSPCLFRRQDGKPPRKRQGWRKKRRTKNKRETSRR